MSEMSPVLRMVMVAMRITCFAVVGLLALSAGFLAWSRHGAQGFVWQQGDLGTLGVMGVLCLIALALAWGAGREINPRRD